jgi:hypothetical protein
VFLAASYTSLVAFDDGIVGFTMKNGTKIGCTCHDLSPDVRVQVTISGPPVVIAGDSATYILRITGGPSVEGGTDIAASLGDLYPSFVDTMLRRAEPYPGAGFELTHKDPKPFDGPIVEFFFKYIAPSTPGVVDTIFGNGNSVNHDQTEYNDRWNFAESFLVTIIDRPLPVELSAFTSAVSSNNVELRWTTTFEENNRSFGIERSAASGIWSNVGEVAGRGNSNTVVNYVFNDKDLKTGNYNYRLKQTDFNGNFTYHYLGNEVVIGNPSGFVLSQNFPNPFNPSTNIRYELPMAGNVTLKVYDMNGKEALTLADGFREAGYYTVQFNGNNLSSGVYYYRLQAGNFVDMKKMLLVK